MIIVVFTVLVMWAFLEAQGTSIVGTDRVSLLILLAIGAAFALAASMKQRGTASLPAASGGGAVPLSEVPSVDMTSMASSLNSSSSILSDLSGPVVLQEPTVIRREPTGVVTREYLTREYVEPISAEAGVNPMLRTKS